MIIFLPDLISDYQGIGNILQLGLNIWNTIPREFQEVIIEQPTQIIQEINQVMEIWRFPTQLVLYFCATTIFI